MYKIQVDISHILKDVVELKFIAFPEHNFGGQYLFLGHRYAGSNKIVNLIIFSWRYNGDIKTLTYVIISKSNRVCNLAAILNLNPIMLSLGPTF